MLSVSTTVQAAKWSSCRWPTGRWPPSLAWPMVLLCSRAVCSGPSTENSRRTFMEDGRGQRQHPPPSRGCFGDPICSSSCQTHDAVARGRGRLQMPPLEQGKHCSSNSSLHQGGGGTSERGALESGEGERHGRRPSPSQHFAHRSSTSVAECIGMFHMCYVLSSRASNLSQLKHNSAYDSSHNSAHDFVRDTCPESSGDRWHNWSGE